MPKPKPPSIAAKAPPRVARGAADGAVPPAPPFLGSSKEAITIRLSRDVLSALYHHQADVRSAGSRRRETTIGAVVETLLRQALRITAD